MKCGMAASFGKGAGRVTPVLPGPSVGSVKLQRDITLRKEGKIMPTCPRCKHCFKTLPGEEQDHNCPKCGWGPEEKEELERYECEKRSEK